MKLFSIVIPIFNEDQYIRDLLKSIFQIDYPADKFEVIVVNDASTDKTAGIVREFPQVQLIDLQVNVGRYAARKMGAEAAKHPHVLFIDSRALADPKILTVLDQLDEKTVIGRVLTVEKPGLFDTFYIAIRRIVFRKYYALIVNPIRLTKGNFDSLPKGTTVLYVQKETLFKAYEALSRADIGKDSSDDIRLINQLVQFTDAVIHPDVKITGLSRTSFLASVTHLVWRGGTFVDYYFHPAKRNFWLVIILPLLAILGICAVLVWVPVSGASKVAALLGLDLIGTLLLARTLREFFVILFMLPVCAATFYFGVVRGIYLKCRQIFRAK